MLVISLDNAILSSEWRFGYSSWQLDFVPDVLGPWLNLVFSCWNRPRHHERGIINIYIYILIYGIYIYLVNLKPQKYRVQWSKPGSGCSSQEILGYPGFRIISHYLSPTLATRSHFALSSIFFAGVGWWNIVWVLRKLLGLRKLTLGKVWNIPQFIKWYLAHRFHTRASQLWLELFSLMFRVYGKSGINRSLLEHPCGRGRTLRPWLKQRIPPLRSAIFMLTCWNRVWYVYFARIWSSRTLKPCGDKWKRSMQSHSGK